jgi:hypothetical protein
MKISDDETYENTIETHASWPITLDNFIILMSLKNCATASSAHLETLL